MSRDFITKEVEKIITDDSFPYPLNLAMASAWILGNFKGVNLKIIDVNKSTSLADYFILGSSQSTTQSRAMADEMARQFKGHGQTTCSVEGMEKADWILLDQGDIIVHIFQEFTREIYDLDDLWKDCPTIEIPQSYYFTGDEAYLSDQSSSEQNYF